MNEKIKNYLGIAIIIVLLVFAYAVINYVGTYSKSIEPSTFRNFSVTGKGEVVAIPDVAQFTFGVITQGGVVIANLQKENTEKINNIIGFLKSSDIEKKDIKTQNYNLTPRYQYFRCPYDNGGPCPPPEIIGYEITQTVLVKIRDFNKIGNVLAGVLENGANSVSELSFTIDDPAALQDQARAEAIVKAKEKAKAIAKTTGFRLGRLLSINEDGDGDRIYRIAEGLAAPSIEPGSQDIIINVTLRYEIE